MEFSFCDTYYLIPIFYPPGVVPGPKDKFLYLIIKLVFIIYWRYYIIFMLKNTFNNTGKKHCPFYGFVCRFFININIDFTIDLFRKIKTKFVWKLKNSKLFGLSKIGSKGTLSFTKIAQFYCLNEKIWPKNRCERTKASAVRSKVQINSYKYFLN